MQVSSPIVQVTVPIVKVTIPIWQVGSPIVKVTIPMYQVSNPIIQLITLTLKTTTHFLLKVGVIRINVVNCGTLYITAYRLKV